jgi:hypothetical protein
MAIVATLLTRGNYNPLNDPYFRIAADLALAAYSREQETQADLRAIRTMEAAGFDPHASVAALERFAPFGVSGTGDLFDNHPSIAQRVARLQRDLPPVPNPQPAAVPTAIPSQAPVAVTTPAVSPGSAALAAPTPVPPSPAPPPVVPLPALRPTPPPLRVRVVRSLVDREVTGDVLIGDRVVMRIRTSYEGQDPFARADAVAERLNKLITAGLRPPEVWTGTLGGQTLILARGEILLVIDAELARRSGTSPASLAQT